MLVFIEAFAALTAVVLLAFLVCACIVRLRQRCELKGCGKLARVKLTLSYHSGGQVRTQSVRLLCEEHRDEEVAFLKEKHGKMLVGPWWGDE